MAKEALYLHPLCPSVLCVTTAPNGHVYVTFPIVDRYECQARNLVEIGQKYASLLLIIRLRFTVAIKALSLSEMVSGW